MQSAQAGGEAAVPVGVLWVTAVHAVVYLVVCASSILIYFTMMV